MIMGCRPSLGAPREDGTHYPMAHIDITPCEIPQPWFSVRRDGDRLLHSSDGCLVQAIIGRTFDIIGPTLPFWIIEGGMQHGG